MCGKEYSLDTSSSEQNSKTVFRTGESETVKCDGTGKPWNFDHENYPDSFMIYPQPVRACKSDGTWSSPIPICVKKDRNPCKLKNRNSNLNII